MYHLLRYTPTHRRLTAVHPHPNPGTVPDTPAFCIARAHNFVTVTHLLLEAHRKQAKLPPRLPTSARDYTRVSFAASTPIAILAYECASEEPSCIQPFPTAATRPPIRSLDFTTTTSPYPPSALLSHTSLHHRLPLPSRITPTTSTCNTTPATTASVAANSPTWTLQSQTKHKRGKSRTDIREAHLPNLLLNKLCHAS